MAYIGRISAFAIGKIGVSHLAAGVVGFVGIKARYTYRRIL